MRERISETEKQRGYMSEREHAYERERKREKEREREGLVLFGGGRLGGGRGI